MRKADEFPKSELSDCFSSFWTQACVNVLSGQTDAYGLGYTSSCLVNLKGILALYFLTDCLDSIYDV